MLRRSQEEGVGGRNAVLVSFRIKGLDQSRKKARPGGQPSGMGEQRGQTGDEVMEVVGRAGRVSPSWFGVWILFRMS